MKKELLLFAHISLAPFTLRSHAPMMEPFWERENSPVTHLLRSHRGRGIKGSNIRYVYGEVAHTGCAVGFTNLVHLFSRLDRVVQLNVTPEIEVLIMLLRDLTLFRTSLKQQI